MEMLTKADAAKYLGVSVRTLDRRLTDNRIKYIQDHPGAKIMISVADLNSYIRSCTHKTKRSEVLT